MNIKWTKEQERKIKELFPDPRQAEAYKEGTELFFEVLKESRELGEEQLSLLLNLKSRYEVLKAMKERILNKDNKCSTCQTSLSKEKMIEEPLSYRVVMSLDEDNLLLGSYLVVCWPCWQGFSWWKEEQIKEKKDTKIWKNIKSAAK